MAKITESDRLIQQLTAQRQGTVEVRTGAHLIVTRPLKSELLAFRDATAYEAAVRWCIGWSGITEADILGEGVGSDVLVDYTKPLAQAVLPDRADWCTLVQEKLIEMVIAQRQREELAAGN